MANQHLMVSAGEKRAIQSAADQLGISMSEFFRRAWAWYEEQE